MWRATKITIKIWSATKKTHTESGAKKLAITIFPVKEDNCKWSLNLCNGNDFVVSEIKGLTRRVFRYFLDFPFSFRKDTDLLK